MAENITNPNEAQIAKWKKDYGKVFTVEIPVKWTTSDGQDFEEAEDAAVHADELADKTINTETVKGWLKQPNRKVIGMASTIGQRDPIKFGEIILKNCWLGGDERIQTDDELFLAVNGVIGDMVKVKTAYLKNC